MRRRQRPDVEFAGRIIAAMPFGAGVEQHAVGADGARLASQALRAFRMVDDQQVVANGVERVDVAPRQPAARIGDRRHLPVEHPIAQFLGAANVLGGMREPRLQAADAPEDAVRGMRVAVDKGPPGGRQQNRRAVRRKYRPQAVEQGASERKVRRPHAALLSVEHRRIHLG